MNNYLFLKFNLFLSFKISSSEIVDVTDILFSDSFVD